MISVGKGGEDEPFMATTFSKKHSILYAAFAGWNDNLNEWKINIPEGKIIDNILGSNMSLFRFN